MFAAMDEVEREEQEVFNFAQKELDRITPESSERWEDNLNKDDRDKDELGMVDYEGPKQGECLMP